MKSNLLYILFTAVLFISCGSDNSPSGIANEYCDCMTEEQQKSDACVKMKEEFEYKMKTLSDEEKKIEMEKLMKEAAECEKLN